MASNRVQAERRRALIADLEKNIRTAQEALTELRKQELPAEPNSGSVVMFKSRFVGRLYTFVAFRWGDYWYITQDAINGAQKPRLKWEQVLEMANTEHAITLLKSVGHVRPAEFAQGGISSVSSFPI